MKQFIRLGVITVVLLSIAACGGGGEGVSRTIFTAQIFSDQPADGDIAFNPALQTLTITSGPDTLFFGIDNLDPNLPEYRAFLDFPLNGSNGGNIVPASAVIVSATLELFLNEVSFAIAVPALLDLVQYPLSGLGPQDFNSLPLMFQRLDFLRSDQGRSVAIDVTPLMQEAQRLVLSNFQVRFLLDLAVSDIGFVGIEDRPRITISAPRLIVEYE